MRNRLAVAAAAGLILASAVAGLSQPLPSLKILVPANPGGGWDQTSRAIEQALRAEKLVSGSIRLTNRGGAGGTIGLAEYAKARGEGGSLMTMGLVMVGAILTNKSPVTLDAVTPIARLTSEYEVIAVPASSRMQTLKDFNAKGDPKDGDGVAGRHHPEGLSRHHRTPSRTPTASMGAGRQPSM